MDPAKVQTAVGAGMVKTTFAKRHVLDDHNGVVPRGIELRLVMTGVTVLMP
ncbi:MAG: hypothetical protein WCS20_02775 [Alphaproteobacteria bacterium]|jgi:hypothetical protein